MTFRWHASALFAVFLLGSSQVAMAQGAPASAPAQPAPSDPKTPKEFIGRATQRFSAGDYAGAIDDYRAAYQLRQLPTLIFNIAQAHRKAGRPREALTHYQLFLRKAPDSPLRPETEAYIALVQTQLQAQASPALPNKPAQDLQSGFEHGGKDSNPTPPRATPFYKRGWFYGVLLGGAATAALAVGLSVYVATRPPATTLGIVDPVF